MLKVRAIYKRRTSIILITEIIITISLLILNFKEIALIMAVSIFIVSLMLILGKIKTDFIIKI
ncbi:hypothetical protein RBU61_07815 [Tissierella sp. MB52-C2]|uniref:hypothetical protein n=1 Tax=Tissierella sp. MB52-C2 TaxID=3070999 RepID=UPI00280BA47F|nr:hypothetical protein [Tissierella sp. MB52-C2]WMM26570.1 hypothetical protein RBU61_07815 [Tissierella sp. MB52-C2]